MPDDSDTGLEPTLAPDSEHPRSPSEATDVGVEATGTLVGHGSADASPPPPSSSSRLIRPPAEVSPSRVDYPTLTVVDPAHYVLGDQIAAGGMGQIVAARDRRLGRAVALKTLLGDSHALAARFEREARITARLQHPGIVQLHEAGVWPSGEPFYAMKLVKGRSLDEVIAACQTLEDRLALMPNVVAVAEAMAYAHEHRVIHRDIKPRNVLVGAFGETVVIDWGLAKDLEDRSSPEIPAGPYRGGVDGQTVAGAVLGTPAYMPVEQARGEGVDERADVYAIGALLYHVLGGDLPYRGNTANDVLDALKAGPPRPLTALVSDLPADLVAIVDKAMARDKADRYPSAVELAVDLRRFTNGQLVGAHTYSAWQLAKRWVRRHRGVVIASTIAAIALGGFSAYSIRRILRERDDAEHARREMAERDERLAVEHAREIASSDPTLAVGTLGKLALDSAYWRELRPLLVGAWHDGIARQVLDAHEQAAAQVRFAPDGRVVSAGPEGTIRSWTAAGGPLPPRDGHRGAVTELAMSRSGSAIASLGIDGTARLWNATTHHSLTPDGELAIRLVGFTHDEADVIVLTRSSFLVCPVAADHPCRRLAPATPRATTGRIHTVVEPNGREVTTRTVVTWADLITRAFVAPAARILIACDGQATAWDLDSGRELWIASAPRGCAGSPAGEVALARDGEVVLVDATTGKQIRAYPVAIGRGAEIAFSPDGRRLAFGHDRIDVVDLASTIVGGALQADHIEAAPTSTTRPQAADPVREARATVSALAFSPTGDRIAWTIGDRSRVATLRGYRIVESWEVPGARALALSFDGARLASADVDGSIRIWSLADARGKYPIARLAVRALTATTDGARLALQSDSKLTITEWKTGRALAEIPLEPGCREAAISREGARAAVICDGKVRVLRVADRHVHAVERQAFAWLSGDRMLAWSWNKPELEVIDAAGRTRSIAVISGPGSITHVRVAREADRAVAITGDGKLAFIDLRTGTVGKPLEAPCAASSASAIAWDGEVFACSNDQVIWFARADGSTGELRGHVRRIAGLDFLSDGRLASTAGDSMLRIWQLGDRQSRAYRIDAATQQRPIAGRGGVLVTEGDRIRLWDLAGGRPSTFPLDARRALPLAAGAVALASNTEVVVFADELPAATEALAHWLRTITAAVRE